MNRANTYAAACRRAARDQGLDPLTRWLRRHGVDVTVEQTGGFCMVATVCTSTGTFAFIRGEEDGGTAGSFSASHYPGSSWQDGQADAPGVRHFGPLQRTTILRLLSTHADTVALCAACIATAFAGDACSMSALSECADSCRRRLSHRGTCDAAGPQRCERCGTRNDFLRRVDLDDLAAAAARPCSATSPADAATQPRRRALTHCPTSADDDQAPHPSASPPARLATHRRTEPAPAASPHDQPRPHHRPTPRGLNDRA